MEPAYPSVDLLLRLSSVEGFTVRHLRSLAGGAPLPLGDIEWKGDPGILEKGCRAMVSREGGAWVDRVRAACDRRGIRVVPIGSPGYPSLLGSVIDAPLVLFWSGKPWRGADGVAVVGSRAPTAPGKAFARELSADLAAGGLTVVSGMARGVDTAAHEGALSVGGDTVAVLGCGVDVLYPPESGRLRDRIVASGAVISEYAPGTAPRGWRFPFRNRIVSGMCRATVVAEAPARSGALVTARLALEQGRETLAVPGSPFHPHTAGSNRLLRDGATPVTCAGDVLLAIGRKPGVDPASPEGRVMRALRRPKHVETVATELRMPVETLLPMLAGMERDNLIGKKSGVYYIKVSA